MGIYEVEQGIRYYVDDPLARTLDKKRKLVSKKDRDFFFLVDGDEGSGKSYLAIQCAKYLDPTFDLSRICMTPNEFMEAIQTAKKAQAVVYDEAFTGMSSRRSMSDVNNMLNETVMECRKKNLFVFICLPTVFFLDKTIVLHRGRVLFHTYFKNELRGNFSVYTKNQLKWLILKGKNTLDYRVVSPKMRLKFRGYFALDKIGEKKMEKLYEKKKLDALHQKGQDRGKKMNDKQTVQRNYLIWNYLLKGGDRRTLLKIFDQLGQPMTEARLSQIMADSSMFSVLSI